MRNRATDQCNQNVDRKTNTSTKEHINKKSSESSINGEETTEQREKQPLKDTKYKQSTSTTNNMLRALSTIKTKKKDKSSFHDKQTELDNEVI